jgi:hypothetical protein
MNILEYDNNLFQRPALYLIPSSYCKFYCTLALTYQGPKEKKVARLPHPILVPAFAGRPAEKCPTNNFFVEKLSWTPQQPPTSESIHLLVLTPVAHHEDDVEGCAYLDSYDWLPRLENFPTDQFHR